MSLHLTYWLIAAGAILPLSVLAGLTAARLRRPDAAFLMVVCLLAIPALAAAWPISLIAWAAYCLSHVIARRKARRNIG